MATNSYEIQDSSGNWTPYTGTGSGNIRSGGTTYSNYAGQQAYQNDMNTPAPASDPATTNPIPTNPDGSQVGSDTPWEAGSQAPSSAPPGYHWDQGMAMFQPDAAAPSAPSDGSGGGATTPPPASASAPPPAAPSAPPPVVAPPAQPSGGPVAPPAMPSGGGETGAPAPTPPSVSQPDTGQAAFGQSIRDALVKALGSPEPTANDPSIAPAIAANRVASERMLQQQRDAIAERLNAQGLAGSGTLDQQMAAAFENSATQQGQFAGNAVLDQAKARRQELVNLLQTGAGILNADDAQAVQAKIADLDAFLRQQSITNQNQQANDQMGLTGAYYRALLQEQANRDYLGA